MVFEKVREILVDQLDVDEDAVTALIRSTSSIW